MLSYINLEKIYAGTFLCLILLLYITIYVYFFHCKVGSLCCIVFSLISTDSNYVEVCQMYIMLLAVEFNVLRTLQETRQSFRSCGLARIQRNFFIANEILCTKLYRVDHNFRSEN